MFLVLSLLGYLFGHLPLSLPEGLCISVPAYASGEHTKKTAILLTLFSGLSEPVGALLTLLIFQPMLTEDRIHFALSFVGGNWRDRSIFLDTSL